MSKNEDNSPCCGGDIASTPETGNCCGGNDVKDVKKEEPCHCGSETVFTVGGCCGGKSAPKNTSVRKIKTIITVAIIIGAVAVVTHALISG